jgi:hypothetical protein
VLPKIVHFGTQIRNTWKIFGNVLVEKDGEKAICTDRLKNEKLVQGVKEGEEYPTYSETKGGGRREAGGGRREA